MCLVLIDFRIPLDIQGFLKSLSFFIQFLTLVLWVHVYQQLI